MLTILGVTFPFFALVLAGYVAAKRGWLPLTAIPGLNGFVLYFALPAMLFRFGANTPMAQLLDGSVALLYTLSATLMVLFFGAALHHAHLGMQVVIEDYVSAHGWRIGLVVGVKLVCYGLAALGIVSTLIVTFGG